MAKKRKNMDSGRLTYIVIPSTTARPLRGDIPHRLVRTAVAGLGILLVAFLILTYIFSTNLAAVHNIRAIKADNKQKEREVQDVRDQLRQIEQKQDQVSKKQNQVKKMMGVENEPRIKNTPSRGGKGGVDAILASEHDTDMTRKAQAMINALDQQEKEVDEMMARVNRDQDYFRRLPNLWPTAGEISSTFGLRDSPFGRGGSETFHKGVDIAAYSGEPVYAAGDGKVIYADWKSGYGRLVAIDHGNGLTSEYGHNSALLVEKGDKVKKGQLISRVGSTGASTGPHLHFTIKKNGNAVDPMIYLP